MDRRGTESCLCLCALAHTLKILSSLILPCTSVLHMFNLRLAFTCFWFPAPLQAAVSPHQSVCLCLTSAGCDEWFCAVSGLTSELQIRRRISQNLGCRGGVDCAPCYVGRRDRMRKVGFGGKTSLLAVLQRIDLADRSVFFVVFVFLSFLSVALFHFMNEITVLNANVVF